ncbi:hypothetical protein, partial [Streptomyces sp.]|uniref:hypothetical protein n=1 Tax=Streptomyces sp. TaxID=1931 RepID=UPI002F931A9F
MIDFVVNGSWGTRPQTVQQLGVKWAETFAALHGMGEDALSGWREDAGPRSRSAEFAAFTPEALTEYIERENRDADDPYIGYVASLEKMQSRTMVRTSILVGGQSVWVTNSVVLSFSSRVVDEDSVPAVRRAHEILRIFADVWDLDLGQVYRHSQDDVVDQELGLENTDPRCGLAVYLSANRAALAPEGLPGIYTRTAHGGLIIDLTHGGTQDPGIETILD